MKLITYCFEEGGPQNTEETLQIARRRAEELGIGQVVVASSHGDTALRAREIFGEGIELTAVSLGYGWESLGWCMTLEEKQPLLDWGVHVVTGIHALGDGVASAFSEEHGGRWPEEIVRDTLYRFSQGMKVAVECLMMAAEAGFIDVDEEAIAIGGTSSGADTALVCKPACPRHFFDLEIREVLAKPRIP